MGEVRCLVRSRWVAASPEELIRQRLLHHMVSDRAFPRSLLAVEVSLAQLIAANSDPTQVPARRLDIVSYRKGDEGVTPLLIVECKAVNLSRKAYSQALGYNYFLHAPFVAIANEKTIVTGYWDGNSSQYLFSEGLPSYDELLCRSQ